MLPLTPANNWTPTILFCGGPTIADEDWGSYSGPNIDTWNVVASQDYQRLTPEPFDSSQPAYEQDDNMLEPRTMGQFIILPTGKLLLLNGGQNSTAGYAAWKRRSISLSPPHLFIRPLFMILTHQMALDGRIKDFLRQG